MEGYVKITAKEPDGGHTELECACKLENVSRMDAFMLVSTLTDALKLSASDLTTICLMKSLGAKPDTCEEITADLSYLGGC